LTGLQDCLSEL